MTSTSNGKFRIVIKRDFGAGPGFWMKGAGNVGTDNYGWVKSGFVVTRGGCNVIPGAAWFRTIEEAFKAIEILSQTKIAAQFWQQWNQYARSKRSVA